MKRNAPALRLQRIVQKEERARSSGVFGIKHVSVFSECSTVKEREWTTASKVRFALYALKNCRAALSFSGTLAIMRRFALDAAISITRDASRKSFGGRAAIRSSYVPCADGNGGAVSTRGRDGTRRARETAAACLPTCGACSSSRRQGEYALQHGEEASALHRVS